MRKSAAVILLTCAALTCASVAEAQAWRSDQGDGTYSNPILYADYPDPDIIRVGQDFYFTTTTFVNTPGITVLHSKDLVNWEIVSHVVPRLDGRPQYDMQGGTAYRSGLFATSLRHHDGMFWLAVTPVGQNTRIYYAKDARGPWAYHELDRQAFDPGLFFDTDGKAYIFTSIGSDGTETLLSLNQDLSRIVDSRKIYYDKGAEGSKVIKKDGWYYLFNAMPSHLALVVSRSRSLDGPWETHSQIDDTTGGHQGALVDLPDGDWYGFVMRDSGAIGRTTNLSPIFWRDGWPVWGTPDAPNQVPKTSPKPVKGYPFMEPATSDDFSGKTLGLQWQWNHNPDDSRWSLSERPGFLRLKATQGPDFWNARNTLTQKGQGPFSRGVVKLDIRHVGQGDSCGFGALGKFNGQIAVTGADKGSHTLSMKVIEATEGAPNIDTRVTNVAVKGDTLWLRTDMDFRTNLARVDYSLDNKNWTNLGGDFPLAYDWRTGTFQGEQYAIFCYNTAPSNGYLDIDSFSLSGQYTAQQAAR
jgi:beta-xylosidase